MPAPSADRDPRSPWAVERALARAALSRLGDPALAVVFWDGTEISTCQEEPVARLVFADRATFWRVVFNPHLRFGDAYADGRIEVVGDLAATVLAVNNGHATLTRREGSRRIRRVRRARNTLRRSRTNVHHHYDLGNDFYRLWLDEQLLYTCAYFPTPETSLEDAQVAKMDHVCRKLRLQPGERVVEAGCGWGALALHMARHYGVDVTAYNVSQEQLAYARSRAQREGLADRVRFVDDDWRNIEGTYDAFVSVGMLEHVGVRNYETLGRTIDRVLTPEGRGLIHSIGTDWPRPMHPWVERRIFPGAQPPSLGEMSRIFEPWGWSVLDVENIRLHYAQTLRHWLDRFEEAEEKVRRDFDEKFVRTWRLYLAGSWAAFEGGWLQLFQVVFHRHTSNQVPRTRDFLYDHSVNAAEVPDFYASSRPCDAATS